MLILAEANKTDEEKSNELLKSGRLVFLQTVGFTASEIAGLGDLTTLPSERMSELLRRKAEEALAETLGESVRKHHPQIERIGGRKRKRK